MRLVILFLMICWLWLGKSGRKVLVLIFDIFLVFGWWMKVWCVVGRWWYCILVCLCWMMYLRNWYIVWFCCDLLRCSIGSLYFEFIMLMICCLVIFFLIFISVSGGVSVLLLCRFGLIGFVFIFLDNCLIFVKDRIGGFGVMCFLWFCLFGCVCGRLLVIEVIWSLWIVSGGWWWIFFFNWGWFVLLWC